MSDTPKPLPCPFCGGEPSYDRGDAVSCASIGCNDCSYHIIESSWEDVLRVWGRRAPMTDEIRKIASAVYDCATSWDPKACLLGNVTADEVRQLAEAVGQLPEGGSSNRLVLRRDDTNIHLVSNGRGEIMALITDHHARTRYNGPYTMAEVEWALANGYVAVVGSPDRFKLYF